MRFLSRLVLFAALTLPFAARADSGPDIHDTRMLSEPAVSANKIAFIYAGDLWTSDLDGSNLRRLTADVGPESSPAFSPDGKWIAFSAQYEGNTDVYVVSSEGGVPRRLTWHPGADVVQGFTPDGKTITATPFPGVVEATADADLYCLGLANLSCLFCYALNFCLGMSTELTHHPD